MAAKLDLFPHAFNYVRLVTENPIPGKALPLFPFAAYLETFHPRPHSKYEYISKLFALSRKEGSSGRP
jgi:hypothetical protein